MHVASGVYMCVSALEVYHSIFISNPLRKLSAELTKVFHRVIAGLVQVTMKYK